MSYAKAHLSEIEQVDDGRVPWLPIRRHFGIRSFGVNYWLGREPGASVINEHDEESDGDEELYFVVSGSATFTVDGEEVDAPAGTLLFVQPEAKRTAVARDAETAVLAVGAKPGEAYVPSEWEVWEPAFAAKDYARAEAAIRELLEERPDDPRHLYNLACCESLTGRRDDALEHLRRAVEGDPALAQRAGQDSDLDGIRGDRRFPAILGAATGHGS